MLNYVRYVTRVPDSLLPSSTALTDQGVATHREQGGQAGGPGSRLTQLHPCVLRLVKAKSGTVGTGCSGTGRPAAVAHEPRGHRGGD